MFTIQYVDPTTRESLMETLDTRSQSKLIQHLARFNHEILAIYEQSTPVTKRTRTRLSEASLDGLVTLSPAARKFVNEGIRVTIPA